MSVEICYVPTGNDKEVNHRLLDPGEGFYINDYSNGAKEIVAIECQTDGMPKVMVLPNEGPLADGFEVDLEDEELPQPISTIYVDEKRPHEHAIVTEDDVIAGVLRIRYADSARVTASHLIPLLLRHPN